MTILAEPNDFGQEWQVRPDEPKLFAREDRAPQYPEKCKLPKKSMAESRRLAELSFTKEDALKACAGVPADEVKNCVYDVLATGDLSYAEAGAF
jgi:hypothetical protein